MDRLQLSDGEKITARYRDIGKLEQRIEKMHKMGLAAPEIRLLTGLKEQTIEKFLNSLKKSHKNQIF